MKAVILAAGKGERLKGIVDDVPKPMVRLQGKPILQSNIEWLKKNGFSDLYVNLHHLPKVITDYFGDGSSFGVSIKYSFEETLLGTAGAVRRIADTLWDRADCEDFIVVYADNFFDGRIDLGEIVRLHRDKKALVTMALHHKEDVSQSGVVVFDEDMRVTDFIEKPKPGVVISHFVNAGFYIVQKKLLDHLAPNKYCDFSKDIFPGLLTKKESFFCTVFREGLVAIDTPEFYQKVANQIG